MISIQMLTKAVQLSLSVSAWLLFAGLSSAEQYPAAKASCTASSGSDQLFTFTLSINQQGDGDTEIVLTGTTTSTEAPTLALGIVSSLENFRLRKLGKPVPVGSDRTYRSVYTVKSGTISLTGPKSEIGNLVEFYDLRLFGGSSLTRCNLQAAP